MHYKLIFTHLVTILITETDVDGHTLVIMSNRHMCYFILHETVVKNGVVRSV